MNPWKVREKARRLLRDESGTILKEGALRVALIYPNTYQIGTSNLGFQIIYRIINSIDDVAAERVYMPDEEDIAVFERGLDLFSLESQRPASEFDVLAFSIPFEGDFLNVLRILTLSKVPLRSEDRRPGDPLVVAGGMATLLNPEPLAPFVDAFVIGEGEEVALEVFSTLREGGPRDALLGALARIEGVYVPSRHRALYNPDGTFAGFCPALRVRKRFTSDLDRYDAGSVIHTPNTTFPSMHLVEVSRGCGGACRFCAEGFVYRYPRHRSVDVVVSEIRRAKEAGMRVGLISPMLLDHPDLQAIVDAARREGVEPSFSSLRADALDAEVVEAISRSGQKTITIAPEAGSDRLRRSVNKHFTNDDVVRAAALAARRGIANLKLYFLVGLPAEGDDDVWESVELVRRIRDVFPRGRITVGANPVVPKPWTPLQWASFAEQDVIERRYAILRKGLAGLRGVELSLSSPREFYVQAVLARGSRRVARLLELAHGEGGNFTAALRRWEVNADFYARRPRGEDETFPWDFIDHGISKAFLLKEYKKSLQARWTPECVTPICKLCGVC